MAFIGKISYSLYLWHFPILSFFRIYKGSNLGLIEIFFCIFFTFIFSTYTYIFIEKKFQNKSLNFITIPSILVVSTVICVLYSVKKNYIPPPFQNLQDQNKNDCFGSRCVFNNQNKSKIYLIGDSTTTSILWHLKEIPFFQNFQIISYLEGGCIFAPGFDKYNIQSQKKDPSCNNDYFNIILNDIYKNPNSIIIIGGNYNEYIIGGVPTNDVYKSSVNNQNEILSSNLKNSFYKLSKLNKIFLIYPAPILKDKTTIRKLSKLTNYQIKNIQIKEYLKFNQPIIDLFTEINNKNIFKITVQDIFCKDIDGYCYVGDDKKSYYWDGFHISKYGAFKISEKLIKLIKKIHFIN